MFIQWGRISFKVQGTEERRLIERAALSPVLIPRWDPAPGRQSSRRGAREVAQVAARSQRRVAAR